MDTRFFTGGIVGGLLLLGGCASDLTGIGGSDKLACKAPDGVTCSSLSGVYANALADNLPGLQQKHEKGSSTGSFLEMSGQGSKTSGDLYHQKRSFTATTGITGQTPSSGAPIFTKPEVVRIWVAPWEDAEGDLHDQSFMYVVANDGRWAIEHNERQIMNRYMPTFLKQPASTSVGQQKSLKDRKLITNSTMTLPGTQGFPQTNPLKLPGQ